MSLRQTVRLFNLVAFTLAFLVTAPRQAPAASFKIDPDHSAVHFEVDHFGYAKVLGRFNVFEGTLQFELDDYTDATLEAEILAESVDTGLAKRDSHLRSPDFFNVQEFPKIFFRSTEVQRTGEKQVRVLGNLTLLGVTAPVTLDVKLNLLKQHPLPIMNNVLVAGFSAVSEIDRTSFGMKYATGGIGSKVKIRIEVEAHIE